MKRADAKPVKTERVYVCEHCGRQIDEEYARWSERRGGPFCDVCLSAVTEETR